MSSDCIFFFPFFNISFHGYERTTDIKHSHGKKNIYRCARRCLAARRLWGEAGDGAGWEELKAKKTTHIQDFWWRPDANFYNDPPLKNKQTRRSPELQKMEESKLYTAAVDEFLNISHRRSRSGLHLFSSRNSSGHQRSTETSFWVEKASKI